MSTTTDQPKIILYWLNKSRSQRILWLLEELHLPYTLSIFHRDPATKLAPPELQEIHPLGKSPILSILPPGSTTPIILAESAFIIEYLLDHYGTGTTLIPPKWKEGSEGKVGGETEEWMRFRYLMHYAEGSMMPLMFTSLIANEIKNSPVPFFIRPITNQIASKLTTFLTPNFKNHFTFLESQLDSLPSQGEYLCGAHLTGADILLSFPLIAGRSRAGLTKEKYPKLSAYVDRLEAEEGYKKAIEKIIEVDGSFDATF